MALRMLDRYSFICFGDGLVTKSCLTFQTLWTVICQAPLSIGFPKQEFWSGLPFSSPGYLPDTGIKPTSHALAGELFTTEPSGKSIKRIMDVNFPDLMKIINS